MKKAMLVFAAAIVFAACGTGNTNTVVVADSTAVAADTAAPVADSTVHADSTAVK